MPVALMIAALCTGLTTSLVWIILDGTVLGAVIVYLLSGHASIAAMAAGVALRNPR